MHLQIFFLFIDCDYLSNVRIGDKGHKTFIYACIILLPTEYSYFFLVIVEKCIIEGFSPFVASKFMSERFNTSQLFAEGVSKEPCLFSRSIYMGYAGLGARSSSSRVFTLFTLGFTFSWTVHCFPEEP